MDGGGAPAVVSGLRAEERGGLARWTYFSPEMLELEKDQLFRRCWQLVGHVNDIPHAGDYITLDMVGERVLAMRGTDGDVRCFRNACRHRGTPLKTDERGSCRGSLTCPFHGWAYDANGRLLGVAKPRSLPGLDPASHGLTPLETEIWMGFLFVRILPGRQPAVADIMRPYEQELAPYRMREAAPLTVSSLTPLSANWKSVRDIDNEGYHVPVAHPFLQDLYGQNYVDQSLHHGTSRSLGLFNTGAPRTYSVAQYRNALDKVGRLGVTHPNGWLYIGMYPNLVFVFYPEQVGYYQEFPLAVDKTVVRSSYYGWPDDRREMKLARYLGRRIDRVTAGEDLQLVVWSWEAMQSSRFTGIILTDLETGVRRYHDWLRHMVPAAALAEEPAYGTLVRTNQGLVG